MFFRRWVVVAALLALAQLVSAQDAGVVEEPRETASVGDTAGYHSWGTGEGPTGRDALVAAKAAGLQLLFAEIGKDALFREMCISGWPEAISVEEREITGGDTGYTAVVRILIRKHAILATEQSYHTAVLQILRDAEQAMQTIQSELDRAVMAEENLDLAVAYSSYRHARRECADALSLVRGIGDRLTLSDAGRNSSTIEAALARYAEEIGEAESRLQRIEGELDQHRKVDERERTYRFVSSELQRQEELVHALRRESPFYDMPPSALEDRLVDIRAMAEKTATMGQALDEVGEGIEEARSLLRSKIELSLADLTRHRETLSRMVRDIERELRLPRLIRQERQRTRKEAWQALGRGVVYVLSHIPNEYLQIEWELPLRWDMEAPLEATAEADLHLYGEGVFDFGMWIRAGIAHAASRQYGGSGAWDNRSWRSRIDIGIAPSTLFGIGVEWDWSRSVGVVADPASRAQAVRQTRVAVHLGGVDRERRRVIWMLTLHYRLPLVPVPFLIPYHLNGDLGFLLRAGDILILRAGAWSDTRQIAAHVPGDPVGSAFVYEVGYCLGMGLRLPPPFTLGISYGGVVRAGMDDMGLTDVGPHQGAWGLWLGYSL